MNLRNIYRKYKKTEKTTRTEVFMSLAGDKMSVYLSVCFENSFFPRDIFALPFTTNKVTNQFGRELKTYTLEGMI